MTPIVAGLIVIAFTIGGALAGRWLRIILPDEHLSSEGRDTIELGIGLVATMLALVLGLVTASAKSSFDSLDLTVKQTAMDVLALDRLLARYGPETAEIRGELKRTVADRIQVIWPADMSSLRRLDPSAHLGNVEGLAGHIETLKPQNDLQRSLQTRAAELTERLLQARWLQATVEGSSIPTLFLLVLLGWMTVTFTCYGLLAPPNRTVATVLFLCSVSVGSAVFLTLEMDGPFDGILMVSPDLLNYALANLGK